MTNGSRYDVAVIGGGLAGLSAAILLSKKGYRVVLFEKEKYPFHKVCGEYISLESWEFLLSLGLHLDEWELPVITQLSVTSPDGTELKQQLPLGGFGVSRFKIDYELMNVARQNNVELHEETRVQEIKFHNDTFTIITDRGECSSLVCCVAAGKRSNLDVKWKRKFTQQKPNPLNHYIGVKYHAVLEHPRSLISLHNFSNGYCGISPIEENNVCVCYLTTASHLRNSGNDIRQLEEKYLYRNAHLKEAFENASMIYDKPLTISQISFDKKEQVVDHMLMLGDSAGMITPLCGNGMSMALFSSRIAAVVIEQYLSGALSRAEMEEQYTREWKRSFGRRLFAGRVIQSLFGKEWITNKAIGILKRYPRLVSGIIRQTHG